MQFLNGTIPPAMAPTMVPGSSTDFQAVYSGVLQSFTVILCGYVAGALKLISLEGLQGLNIFVGTFCLPALIFTSLSELDLASVNWTFLLAIFISKAIVFTVVLLVSLLVNKTNRIGKSGLYAMFCTQSNDFAIGYPIVASLYNTTHPDYANYLYLIAPINLVMLNPFGFICLEVEKEMNERIYDSTPCRWKLFFKMAKGILFNPIVFMTILGIVGNLAFNHSLPTLLEGILKILGSAFSATALFVLGLHMAGNQRESRGSGIITIGILVVIKTFLLPVVIQEVVYLLNAGITPNDTMELSNYGFLYGTFPTAPGVFVYASQYNLAVDTVARGLVGTTFLSAPLIMISAKMATSIHLNPLDYIADLDSFIFDVGLFGLVGSAWVIAVYFLTKKWKVIPHCMTLQLFLAQLLTCIAAIVWGMTDCKEIWSLNLQYAFLTFGVYSTRIWAALAALTVLFLQTRSLCFVLRLRFLLMAIGWGVPAVLVTFLTLTLKEEVLVKKQHPLFQYGKTQAIVSLILLLFTYLVTVSCLIIQERMRRRMDSIASTDLMSEEEHEDTASENPQICVTDIEDLITENDKDSSDSQERLAIHSSCPGEMQCDTHHRKICNRLIRDYRDVLPASEQHLEDTWDDSQQFRHTVLFLLLSCSMVLGIALCIWTLVLEAVTGIYVELVFMDAALNYGQGFFAFFLFGINKSIISIIRR